LNPGAVALLDALGLNGGPLHTARRLSGMLLTGPRVSVAARYQGTQPGLAILRRDLDQWLLERAVAAGARFEPGWVVREPLVDVHAGRPLVKGVMIEHRREPSQSIRLPASMTIAADGRRSVLAKSLGLSAHPRRPRRWAFGTYATGVANMSDLGEMHVRPSHYLGIAPLSGDLVNVCVVTGRRPEGRTPIDIVKRAIAKSPEIAARFEAAEFVTPVTVLGPLAVDVRAAGVDGLLLAGDAAGFIDPMTGDGLHLAMRGAVLAAHEVKRVLESGDLTGAPERLATARRNELRKKLRFNRAVRRFVSSPVAIGLAELGARVAPGAFMNLVNFAGDVV
jgi:flavin-dependent dehydrogenase